jgi:hypothetical protein
VSLLFSTGLKGSLAVAMKAVFDGGIIRVYSGPPPASPDLAPTGTHIGSITRAGVPDTDPLAGLIFEAAGPYLVKPTVTDWALRVDVNGTAGWWRLSADGDNPDSVLLDTQRVDGVIGTGDPVAPGVTLWLPSLSLVAGQQHPIDYFLFAFPPLVES